MWDAKHATLTHRRQLQSNPMRSWYLFANVARRYFQNMPSACCRVSAADTHTCKHTLFTGGRLA